MIVGPTWFRDGQTLSDNKNFACFAFGIKAAVATLGHIQQQVAVFADAVRHHVNGCVDGVRKVEYIPVVSKAFTRESDDASADEIAPARPQVSAKAKNYITREGADRLRNRLEELLEQRRVLVNEGSNGNANAKAALRNLELAIQKLQSTLNSVIIAERPANQTGITFGASVRIRDENGEEETYQIVGIDEADPANGRISSVSPLAKALLSHRAGEKVRFQSPAGSQELTILSVHS